MRNLSWPRRIALILASAFYIGAGILHFTKTAFYLKIMPPYIPWHLGMVQITGVCEILGGLGLSIPPVRRAAAWGLVALLIAVFPANIYMVTNPASAGAGSLSPLLLWGRLPLQLVFIVWVLWATDPSKWHAATA